jgi:hypothetical protein
MIKTYLAAVAALALAIALTVGASTAAPGDNTPRATEIHGLPGNNPANGGSSANPNGGGVNGGNGIHNIAGGAPGQGAGAAANEAGRPPACNMHGGLATGVNQNC